LFFREQIMDATDHEYPPTTETMATAPEEQSPDPPTAGEEGATLSTAPADDADPMHESGYGFGV
jgi:hypothetical protein